MSEVESPAISGQWTQFWSTSYGSASVQPMRRSAHSTIVFEDNLYVFGGISTNAANEDIEHNDTWVFDLVNRQWAEVLVGENRPTSRFHHAGLLHTNSAVSEFIIFGGLSLLVAETDDATIRSSVPAVQYNDVWRLRLTDDTPKWIMDPRSANLISDVPDARSEAGVVIYNEFLFMFGGIAYDEKGEDNPVNFNDLWRYDLNTFTWEKMESAGFQQPPERFSHSVALLYDDNNDSDAYLLVYSGRHLLFSSWTLLDDAWVYDLRVNEWLSITPSTYVPRAYTSIVTTKGSNMWFFGGYYKPQQSSSGYVYDDIVLGEFDFQKMELEARHVITRSDDASPSLRYNHQATIWRGDSMVIHGGSYQSQLGDVWVFNTTNAVTIDANMNKLPLDPESLAYMLGAFILVIIFVLLAVIFRWRRADRTNLRAAQMRGVAVVRGVMKERLDQLQITKYNRSERKPDTRTEQYHAASDNLIENEDICPICLIDFEDGEDVRNLPCKHIFHVTCIDEWLKRNTSCPMCKCNVDLDAVNPSIDPPPAPILRGGAVVTPVT
ncbi:putative Zinc finger, RING-type, kelch-type beta propeller [Plasmopara halstedii]